MSVPDITVYVVRNPDGKVHVRTTSRTAVAAVRDGTPDDRGFQVTEAALNWQAQRAIAQMYRDAGGELINPA
jgi:hypothetical protein